MALTCPNCGVTLTATCTCTLAVVGPPPPPPPGPVPGPPVDCVLTPFAFKSAGAWGACQPNGTQARTETWTRTVVTPAANGGAACGPLAEVRTATQPCLYVPPAPIPPPPSGGAGNAYFDSLAVRPDVILAKSLRTAAQLATRNNGGYAYANSLPLDVVYDPALDAAKATVGTGSNSMRNQLRIPFNHGTSGFLVTWDIRWGASFIPAQSGLVNYKAFQLASPAETIWTEIRARFSQAGAGKIGKVDMRPYGATEVPKGGADSIAPMVGSFDVAPDVWTRYWVRMHPRGTGWWNCSLWVADVTRPAVQLLNNAGVKPKVIGWEQWWLELNTSTDVVKPGRGPLTLHARNLAILRDVPEAAMPGLLVKPV